jgi:hypothetical protein
MEREPARPVNKVREVQGVMLDLMSRDHHITASEAFIHTVNTLGISLSSEEVTEVFEYIMGVVYPLPEER